MINIQDIIPFMKKGWVAMDENGENYYTIDDTDGGLYFEHARRLTKKEIEELC